MPHSKFPDPEMEFSKACSHIWTGRIIAIVFPLGCCKAHDYAYLLIYI